MTNTAWTTPEKVSLLLNLIAYLRANGPTELGDLAQHFGVPEKQVRRLVEFIGTAGVPGESATYQHQDLYDLDWDALELDGIVHLKHVVGVDGTPRFTSTQASAILAGLHSMKALLTPAQLQIASAAEEKLRLATTAEPTTLSVSTVDDPLADRLAVADEAIAAGKQLAFSYRGANDVASERVVDVHRLFQLQGAWCFEGWCHDREAMRTFRVDLARGLEVLDAGQTHPAEHENLNREASETGIDAEALVDETVMYRLGPWDPEVLGTEADGRARVRVSLMHEARAITLVSLAPGLIELVQPPHLRRLVADWATQVARAAGGAWPQAGTAKDSVH